MCMSSAKLDNCRTKWLDGVSSTYPVMSYKCIENFVIAVGEVNNVQANLFLNKAKYTRKYLLQDHSSLQQ
jgi:hypothetical protein